MNVPEKRVETRIDPYVDAYASRTKGLKASAVRALFAVANRPEVVSLAGGMPNIADLPLDVVGDSIADLIRRRGPQIMNYGSAQGEERIREQICEVMRLEQIEASPDDIIVSCGSQQALDLVTRTFVDPGDVILAEAPSYVGALGTFAAYQANVVHVAMDEDGIIPEAFRAATIAVRAAGRQVKFLYTIPNFNNPSGILMTIERRRQLIALAEELDVLIVEDNPYGLLALDLPPQPAIRSMDSEHVIYLGSFSKTFAPGFRVGWALAPPAVLKKLVLAQESATLCPPVFSQFAISEYLSTWDWKGQIDKFRSMYRERRDAMMRGLIDHMPAGATWTHPKGGFFVWLTLPEGFDSDKLSARAITHRVAFTPGTAFYADGLGSRSMRLSYCFPTPERIYEGTRRLGETLREEIELRATFGLVDPHLAIEAASSGGPASTTLPNHDF
ncbi:MAG: PLP-dependent aminotransferase family protein [Propionibacteriaceae bacterium]|jgi:DNA-binding transcriptional MocR family regulator|nr:PLP-dependent aminotransferase family protein [Propionibacteriaceae bacterium]